MEIEETECVESDPERDGSPCNEDLSHRGTDGEYVEGKKTDEEEESDSEEEQQGKVTVNEEDWHTCSEDEEEEEEGVTAGSSFHNSSRLLHKDELLNVFKAVHNGPKCKEGELTVGLVGEILDSYSDQVTGYK